MTAASWPAPLGSRAGRSPAASTASDHPLAQRGVAADRGLIEELLPLDADAARLGGPLGALAQLLDGGRALGVVGVAHVEAELGRARDHVRRARRDREPADGRDERRRLARERLRRQHHLGGGAERVVAKLASGPSRRAPATPPKRSAARVWPGDRGDHAEGDVAVVEHRSLLDVHLDVAGQRARRPRSGAQARRVAPGLADRVVQRDAVRVDPLQVGLVEAAG